MADTDRWERFAMILMIITIQKNPSAIETKQKKKLDIIGEDKEKEMLKKWIVKEMIERMERQNKKETNSIQTIRKKLEIERDIKKEKEITKEET